MRAHSTKPQSYFYLFSVIFFSSPGHGTKDPRNMLINILSKVEYHVYMPNSFSKS